MRTSDDELKQFNAGLIAEFRANGGEVRGWHPLLLLTTVGAKSGQPHTTPLSYRTDGERLLVYTNSGQSDLKEAYAYQFDINGKVRPAPVRAV